MNITVHGKGTIEFPEGTTAEDVVKKLGFHKDAVIVLQDDVPIPIDKPMEEGVNVKIIHVVSGG